MFGMGSPLGGKGKTPKNETSSHKDSTWVYTTRLSLYHEEKRYLIRYYVRYPIELGAVEPSEQSRIWSKNNLKRQYFLL